MLKLISFAFSTPDDTAPERELPENRKKSANMLMASNVVRKLLADVRTKMELKDINLLFCSGEGEIQQTFEYFKFLSQNHARPILFQNSLHNSTLGALSLEVPHIASGITVSSGDLSFESAIDVALSSPSKLPVLILGVDVYNDEVRSVRAKKYGPQISLADGGCAALFLPKNHPEFNRLQGPVIKNITMTPQPVFPVSNAFYPANGMIEIAERLKSPGNFSVLRPGFNVEVTTSEA